MQQYLGQLLTIQSPQDFDINIINTNDKVNEPKPIPQHTKNYTIENDTNFTKPQTDNHINPYPKPKGSRKHERK